MAQLLVGTMLWQVVLAKIGGQLKLSLQNLAATPPAVLQCAQATDGKRSATARQLFMHG